MPTVFATFGRLVVLGLVAAALGGCAVEIEEHNLVSVVGDQAGRGTATEFAVPPEDAAAVTIAAIESGSFAVHSSELEGDDVRLLVSRGMTAWSGGEVGRVDLGAATDGETDVYAVVFPLATRKGAPSVEGEFLPDWRKTIAERYATLKKNRADGAYEVLRVGNKKKGEPFSTSGRGAALGFLAGGIAGAIVGGEQDQKRGMRTPWIYELARSSGVLVEVRSFSPARRGACVGLSDYDMEPEAVDDVVAAGAARKAAIKASKNSSDIDQAVAQTPPPDPTAGLVVLVPLPQDAC